MKPSQTRLCNGWSTLSRMIIASVALTIILSLTLVIDNAFGKKPEDVILKQATYAAEIRRTDYGVPHIKADDYASLGFGVGYAQAEDNICEIADRVLAISAERSRYFGPGAGNLNSDIYYQRLINTGLLEKLLNGDPASVDTPSENARDFARGYAAGISRYIRDTGVSNLLDPRCRGAEWVRQIGETDIWRAALAGAVVTELNGVATAQPPTLLGLADIQAASEPPPAPVLSGSNAYGLGGGVTRSGHGMLLANPHYPWDGSLRFYRMHLTIPGQLNVVGASLITSSVVGIGHNESMAWTHTVSTARRYGYFELTLVPGDPTSYFYEGEVRQMTPIEVTVQALQNDGSLQPVTRTLYETQYGPMVETTRFPWTTERGYALRTAPVGIRSLDQYLAIWSARNVRELYDALGKYQSTGYNTTAADASGEALYGDMGAIPHVTDAKANNCIISETGEFYWNYYRIPVLDGSCAECNWGTDPDSAVPGIFGPSRLPQLFRSDFVHQANDSYWLTNPNEPITGLPRIFGDEKTARSLRTRMGLKMIEERVAGTDGLGEPKFALESLQGVMYSNRGLAAEMVRDDLVDLCLSTGSVEIDGETIDLTEACEVLDDWDLRVNIDSRGAHLFHFFVTNGGLRWKIPFDVNDPVNTPNTLDTDDTTVINALGEAVKTLNAYDIPLDAPLGDVQTEPRGSDRIPIHGGSGGDGIFNVIIATNFQPELGWTKVRTGSSFIMTVEFTDDGPRSEGILTYSQSTNPDSPHYADQTWLYSQKGWDDLRFSEEAVISDALQTYTVLEGENDCKNGGWKKFDYPSFDNQGECVSYFTTLRGGVGN